MKQRPSSGLLKGVGATFRQRSHPRFSNHYFLLDPRSPPLSPSLHSLPFTFLPRNSSSFPVAFPRTREILVEKLKRFTGEKVEGENDRDVGVLDTTWI